MPANFRSGYVEQGQPLGMITGEVNLTADNQLVSANPDSSTLYSLIRLSSDNTTAANRTFTLQAGVIAGQQLVLNFVSGASTTCQLADTGNAVLVAAWEPTQYDTLTLVWNEPNSVWQEVCRTSATGFPSIPLASAEIIVGNAGGVGAAVAMTGDIAITNGGVTSIATGAIVNADVSASAAIDYSKLAALASARLLVGSAGNVATAVDVTGDVTISDTGVTAIASGVVTVADMSAAVMREATGTLTAANIAAMNATPVELIAAPAAGLIHIIDEIELLHDYDTAAYADGGDISIEYGTSGVDISVIDVAWLQDTADSQLVLKPSACYSSSASTSSETNLLTSIAKPIQITNATAAFTGGDVANIVKYRIRYHTVTALV